MCGPAQTKESCSVPAQPNKPVPAASPPLLLRRHHGHQGHGHHLRRLHRRHRRRRHCHRHQLPLPPPPSPASSSPGGKQAKPALLRPCALHPRPCELPASLLPASGVAGDAVATLCASSRGTGARLPHPAYAHASAALAWQAVAVQMGLAAGSRSGGRQVAKSRVAFCRSFRLRGSPRSEAGFA